MTARCRVCGYPLDPVLTGRAHPNCAPIGLVTADASYVVLALLDRVIGIDPIYDDRDGPAGDDRDGLAGCAECGRAVPAGTVRHARCYRQRVDQLHRSQPHRTGYRIRPSDFRSPDERTASCTCGWRQVRTDRNQRDRDTAEHVTPTSRQTP